MIAIDLSPLVFAPQRGVARALLHLLEGLKHVPRGSLSIRGFLPGLPVEVALPDRLQGLDRTQRVGPPGATPRVYRHALRATLRATGADVLLSPWAAFPRMRVPVVAWIHEVPFARHGALEGLVRTLRHRRALARAAEHAAALVVPTQAVRGDLLAVHPDAAARVHVVPHGFVPRPWDPPTAGEPTEAPETATGRIASETVASAALPAGERWPFVVPAAPYVLLVGTGRGAAGPWKKGVDLFQDAMLDERLQGLTPVLVGRVPDRTERTIVLEEPPDRELRRLLAGARVVVVASRSEGFGYPVLEGFAAGVPVVASAAGALPEVSGGAARLVPPGDVEALAEAILRVHADEDLRARMIKAGHRRAQQFPVEAMARGWLRVLTQAGGLPWHA